MIDLRHGKGVCVWCMRYALTQYMRLSSGRLGALLEHESELALSAVLTVLVPRHEDASTALRRRALPTKALDVAITVDLVVLEDGHLNLLALVRDTLRGGVNLLLPLLGTTTKAEDEVKGRLLLDVVVRKGATIFELLTSKDETLLIRGNSFLVLDLGLDVVDGVRRLDLEGDRLTRESFNKDLHLD